MTGTGGEGRRCGACRAPLAYAGRGRPPRYCSPRCRTRAWAVRRYGGGRAGGDEDGHQVAGEAGEPAPAVGAALPGTAREWAAILEELAVAIATGPLGKRHYDHRHLAGPLQRIWAALDATHPGGVEALQRAHRGRR